MKKISVIVPCYNVQAYIDRLMESLLSQTMGLQALELIFVNDASTDETCNKLLEYEKIAPESIMVVNLEENKKQGGARNVGMAYASGEYLSFLDADDYIEKDMLEMLYSYAKQYDLDMVGGKVMRHEEGKAFPMVNHLKTGMPIDVASPNERMDLILHGYSGGICSKIYKRNIILENDIFFPEGYYYEDNYWLGILNLYVDRYYIVDRIVYHYIDHPSSTIHNKDDRAITDHMVMEKEKLGAYAKRGFLKTYYIGIEAVFCRSFFVDTLCMLYRLRGEIPEYFYEVLKKEVNNLFPRCMENFMLSEKDKELLSTAFENLTTKAVEKRVETYLT